MAELSHHFGVARALNTAANPAYIPTATETEEGLMSAADKTALDNLVASSAIVTTSLPAVAGAAKNVLYILVGAAPGIFITTDNINWTSLT